GRPSGSPGGGRSSMTLPVPAAGGGRPGGSDPPGRRGSLFLGRACTTTGRGGKGECAAHFSPRPRSGGEGGKPPTVTPPSLAFARQAQDVDGAGEVSVDEGQVIAVRRERHVRHGPRQLGQHGRLLRPRLPEQDLAVLA